MCESSLERLRRYPEIEVTARKGLSKTLKPK